MLNCKINVEEKNIFEMLGIKWKYKYFRGALSTVLEPMHLLNFHHCVYFEDVKDVPQLFNFCQYKQSIYSFTQRRGGLLQGIYRGI